MDGGLLLKKILAILAIAFILIGYAYAFRALNVLASVGVSQLFEMQILK